MALHRRFFRLVRMRNVSAYLPALAAGLALVGTYVATRLIEREVQQRENCERAARAPVQSRQGCARWKHIIYRTYREVGDDRLLALAAGVVLYALLALFPAITAVVSSYALFAAPSTIAGHLAQIQDLMPASAYGIVSEQVMRIVGKTNGGLSFAFVVGLALAIWSANAGIKAIIDALNIVYGVAEQRGLHGGFDVYVASALSLLRWPFLIVLLLTGLAVLYRFGPDREHPRWQWFSAGAIFASLAWIVGSALLSWYLANFANYDATYGSLGAAIGLMMWLWLGAIVILLGAELNCEIAADGSEQEQPFSSAPPDRIGAL